ncbi:Reverse transcriptase (RNA-dependent DNA polymerase) [Desulfocurvibacter africanus PCS]|uniref:Reverse transcriptase (RNA-dependent DNA polymerase) n=1 Tax=Desulfocurvibacter africanus PCS TaxID=1262666 RepID=M5PQK8_DESAF|nr:RNA-directed DNA polymerase [Desulfocurvibacter africanus]EMG36369.1 Reverse transcriptase (RNA-dependent DNA polymerase) [Desulfocurvibacter africanus PCS]
MIAIKDLIGKGYFPKELPPPFYTDLLSQHAIDSGSNILPELYNSSKITFHARHNQLRSGSLRRILSIPNPISQCKVAHEIYNNWGGIINKIEESDISISKPKLDEKRGRALEPLHWLSSLPKIRARARAGCRYLVKADVSRFYPTIYTHSIPWALHGKDVAKRNRWGDLLGNRLDVAIRNGQDGQTVGIPIGPDTSLAIAELILSQVDKDIAGIDKEHSLRYMDDYEIACLTLSHAESIVNSLENALAKFELQLNPRKVEIVELPEVLDTLWVSELRNISLSATAEKAQFYNLVELVNKAFYCAKLYPDSGVLKYCLGRIAYLDIYSENFEFVYDIALQFIMAEPSVISTAIPLFLYDFFVDDDFDKAGDKISRLKNVLEEIICRHSELRHGSEVAWALWCASVMDITLNAGSLGDLFLMDDSVVGLIALSLYHRGKINGAVDLAYWSSMVTRDHLFDAMWLIAYESVVKNWLPSANLNFIDEVPEFAVLRSKGVSFFNNEVEPQTLVDDIIKQRENSEASRSTQDDIFDLGYFA